MARILVVDDDLLVLEMLEFRLMARGHEVFRAHNGQQGVDQAMALSPDLILMDMRMPLMNGDEAVRRLRAAGYTGIIVSLSASAMPSELARAMEVGCDHSLSKPIDRDFEQQIDTYLAARPPA